MTDTMGADYQTSRQMTDAWIFLSIGDAAASAGFASLRDVVLMADANNHAIPSAQELESSVSRLIAAGLADAHGEFLGLSPEGRKRYEAAWTPGVGHIDRMIRLAEQWELEDYPPAAPLSWSVPRDA